MSACFGDAREVALASGRIENYRGPSEKSGARVMNRRTGASVVARRFQNHRVYEANRTGGALSRRVESRKRISICGLSACDVAARKQDERLGCGWASSRASRTKRAASRLG